jgi:hypothetical protein
MTKRTRRTHSPGFKAKVIIAAAIGELLGLKLQHVGHSQHGGLGGSEQAVHFVQDHGRGDDLALQHQLAGDLQRFQPAQRMATSEGRNHVRDRDFLIVAGDEDSDAGSGRFVATAQRRR